MQMRCDVGFNEVRVGLCNKSALALAALARSLLGSFMVKFNKSDSAPRLPPRTKSSEDRLPPLKRAADGSYEFPPLLLHGDPLAAAMVARSGPGGLTQETLRAAIVLNATRIAAILRSWFPADGLGPVMVDRSSFIDVLGVLGLRQGEEDESAGVLFDRRLDTSGEGTADVVDVLAFILGPEAASKGSGIGGIGGGGGGPRLRPERRRPRANDAALIAAATGLPPLAGPRHAPSESDRQARIERHMYGSSSGYAESRGSGSGPRPAASATLGASMSAPMLVPRESGGARGARAKKGRGGGVVAVIGAGEAAAAAAASAAASAAAGTARGTTRGTVRSTARGRARGRARANASRN